MPIGSVYVFERERVGYVYFGLFLYYNNSNEISTSQNIFQ